MGLILILLVAALAVLGGAATAQDIPVFCGDLSEADCQLLTEATETMQAVESAVFHLDFDFAMSGLTQPGMDSISFQIRGDGAFAVDGDALSALGAFYTSPDELMENVEDLPQMFEEAIQAISADVTLVIAIPPELSGRSSTPLPETVSLSARLVDGFGYINLDKMAELDTGGTMPRGWQGINVAGLYGDLLEQQVDMMGEMFSSMSGLGTMNAFANPDFLERFMTIERVDDSEINGQAAAVFQTSLDYGAMFSDPAVLDALRSSLEGMEGFGDTRSNQAAVDMMMNMYSQLFDGLVLEMTQTVGLDDHYVHRAGFSMDWAPDFGAMFGGSSADMPDMRFVFDVQIELARFNDAPEISAPEDANIYPVEGLLSRRGILRGDFGSN